MRLRFPIPSSISLLFLSNLLYGVVESLDSDHNEPTFKFGVLAGEPNSLNGSTSVTVSSFEECVQKCEEDVECILASQVGDGEPCNLFAWNTVTGVRNNASGGVGMVAFKLFTNQPSCELNIAQLLNGKTYQLFANNTDEYLWRIDTSEDGYQITYIGCNQDDSVICGNWGFNRPYPDSCNAECNVTMVQVYARPYLPVYMRASTQVSTWQECMTTCFNQKKCLVAYWQEGTTECQLYGVDGVWLLERTTAADGAHMVIKLPLSSKSCFYTTQQLLDDNYYVPFPYIHPGYRRAFFRVQTTEKYYKIGYYKDETQMYMAFISGCPCSFLSNTLGYTAAEKADNGVCYRIFARPNITQPEAKNFCEQIGGHLFVERNSNMTQPLGSFSIAAGYPSVVGSAPSEVTAWFGLEKDAECVDDSSSAYCKGNQKWQWSDPSWTTLIYNNKTIPMTWATGEPADSKEKNCAYFKKSSDMPSPGYAFYSATCDQSGIGGFFCGMYTQGQMGVKTYAELAAEYGVTEDCCEPTLDDVNYD